jgi:hypothetical protein
VSRLGLGQPNTTLSERALALHTMALTGSMTAGASSNWCDAWPSGVLWASEVIAWSPNRGGDHALLARTLASVAIRAG